MSSGEFSFDPAAPAETMEGTMESGGDSTIHSSPETGSFSQVTSVSRPESTKRQRPMIEDMERESRPVGRDRGSASRQQRSTSVPRTGRAPSVRRTHGKAKSSGGSPNDRKKVGTADEEMDARIKEMYRDQDSQQKEQIQRLEDENTAQRMVHESKLQSIKDECTEFDHQYNHVLDCWRKAEEKSKTYESELRSEAMLFLEAKQYLGEMQQQFGHVMQEDQGAGMRIQELEQILERERMQFRSLAASIDQETRAEFAALRDRADRVRLEASEAIASKDHQQFHERELISDEAMKLKRRNDMLTSELSFAQNDAIQAAQLIHHEQRTVDAFRRKNAEEEMVVRNLHGEMNVTESYLNMENAKNDRLTARMDEDRKRYEQRLALFMSNPETRYPDVLQQDLASKVEIQRLKQELAVAENSLSIVPSSGSEMTLSNLKMKRELEETMVENQELKKQGSFEFWRQKHREVRDDHERAKTEMYKAFEERRQEERLYAEEEREARHRNEDVDRLRRERNEWREQYDNLMAEWTEYGHEYEEEEEEEARETRSESFASVVGYSTPKISRKEADKVVVPNWPRIHELEYWKSQVTANIVAASGDLDHDAWTSWIAPTFKLSPDIEGDLAGSGDVRYNSVDVKLASALMAMMQNGGDQAREVLNEARLKMAKGCRGGTPTILKGRQLLAMIVDSFRSASNTDLVFTIRHLYDLPYPGDNDLVTFKSQWNEVLECMRPGDVPNDVALRDILYDKIRNSKLMVFDLHYYESKEETHVDKTYKYLMDTISKHIKLRREEKNRDAQKQGLKHITSRYKSLPATTNEDDSEKPAKAAPTPKAKNPAGPPKAVPVLADPKVKPHSKGGKGGKGKGKGKGKPRDRTRSPSVPRTAAEKKKIPCRFYFGTGTTCTKGRDCEYSHSKDSPRANSPAGDRKSVCYAFLQGKCSKGKDCKYTHDKKALAVVKASVKAAAAKTQGSSGGSPRNSDPKAAPSGKAKAKASAVALAIHSDDSDNESFCSDISTVSKLDKGCLRQPNLHRRIRKDMKLKFVKKHDVIKYHVHSDHNWSKSFNRKRTGRRVSEKELLDNNRIDQIKYEELRSKVRGLALERSIDNPKKGNAKATINGTWKLDITVNKDPNSPDLFIEKFYRDENEDNEGNSDLANAQSTVKISKKVKFIMDTGCGYDLISQRKAIELGLKVQEGNDRMVFMTANGITETRDVAKCTVDSFGEEAKPFVLGQTPAVFSVGMRCMKLGYTFVWPPGNQPFMINPSGKRIDLHSKDDIPYLIPGEGSGPHDDQLATDIHELLNRKVVVTDAPAVAGEGGEDEGDGPDVAEAEDDGLIEVDVHEGEQRMAKPGVLKAEAKTIAHLLTHRYRNPYCQSCVRAKMKHFRTHRGAFKRELKKWGDLITFDFADLEWTNYMGIPDDRELLVIRDRFTGVIQAFPLKGKTTEEIVSSIKRFTGNRKVALAFSDQAPQFVKACRELRITLDTSVPGRKVTNSLAERNIQFLVGATATCLLEAGLPACYWSFAVTCVSHLLNIEELDEGSAWQKMHKEKFKGPMIPLGAKVIFKPSDARWREQDTKFDPKGLYGVFAGYVIEAGNKWSRRMLVWNLHDFKKVNLAFNCEKVPMLLQRPNVTERVEAILPITFPLKEEYEKLNGTLEGMNTIDDRDGRPEIEGMIGDEYRDEDDDDGGYEPTEVGDDDYRDDDDDPPPPGGKSSGSKPDEKVIPPKRDILDEHPDHYSYGSAGDGSSIMMMMMGIGSNSTS